MYIRYNVNDTRTNVIVNNNNNNYMYNNNKNAFQTTRQQASNQLG